MHFVTLQRRGSQAFVSEGPSHALYLYRETLMDWHHLVRQAKRLSHIHKARFMFGEIKFYAYFYNKNYRTSLNHPNCTRNLKTSLSNDTLIRKHTHAQKAFHPELSTRRHEAPEQSSLSSVVFLPKIKARYCGERNTQSVYLSLSLSPAHMCTNLIKITLFCY